MCGRAQRAPSQGRTLRLGVPLTWRAIERRMEDEGEERQKRQPRIRTWICSLTPSCATIAPADTPWCHN